MNINDLDLRALMDLETESYRPDTDPTHPNPLTGTVIDTDEFVGDYGTSPVLSILDESGTKVWRLMCFGSVLANQVAKQRPEVGDSIGVKYLGEEDARNFPGKKYKNYRVVVKKANGNKPAIDWDKIAAESEVDLGNGEKF